MAIFSPPWWNQVGLDLHLLLLSPVVPPTHLFKCPSSPAPRSSQKVTASWVWGDGGASVSFFLMKWLDMSAAHLSLRGWSNTEGEFWCVPYYAVTHNVKGYKTCFFYVMVATLQKTSWSTTPRVSHVAGSRPYWKLIVLNAYCPILAPFETAHTTMRW